MTKRLIDVDDDKLDSVRAPLGTRTGRSPRSPHQPNISELSRG